MMNMFAIETKYPSRPKLINLFLLVNSNYLLTRGVSLYISIFHLEKQTSPSFFQTGDRIYSEHLYNLRKGKYFLSEGFFVWSGRKKRRPAETYDCVSMQTGGRIRKVVTGQ